MKPHYETEIEFDRVAQIFLFHMTMWTAIQILGHNLFLGVIIDTFGELRGLKVNYPQNLQVSFSFTRSDISCRSLIMYWVPTNSRAMVESFVRQEVPLSAEI